MTYARQETATTYRTLEGYYFTVVQDGADQIYVRNVEYPRGRVLSYNDLIPSSVQTDIQDAIAVARNSQMSAVSGTVTFTSHTSRPVVFATAMPTAAYRVVLPFQGPLIALVESQTTTGFTIVVATEYTGTVGFDVFP